MTDAATLLSFRRNLKSCTSCPLHTVGNGPVPWRGDIHPHYAVMGEAPGRTEDAKGQPFVGDSGAILGHWLKQTGFNPEEMAFLNAVQCYPKGTPTGEHVAACRGWMNGQLEFIRPRVLITMGVTAYRALVGEKWPELKHVHGRPLIHPVYDFRVWPTYHPSAYLHGRNVTYEKKIVTDLEALRDWDGLGLDECWIRNCGGEIYNYDEWKRGLCLRHSQRQGILFPEDVA